MLEVDNARRTERFIHGMLAPHRVVGEWFEVPDAQKGYLLAYFTDTAPQRRRPATAPQLVGAQHHPVAAKHAEQGGPILPDAVMPLTAAQKLIWLYIDRYPGEHSVHSLYAALGVTADRAFAALLASGALVQEQEPMGARVGRYRTVR